MAARPWARFECRSRTRNPAKSRYTCKGFPRAVPHEAGPDTDPFSTITRDAFAAWIKKEPLLFSPGSAVLYSNFGFDLLAMSLQRSPQMDEVASRPLQP